MTKVQQHLSGTQTGRTVDLRSLGPQDRLARVHHRLPRRGAVAALIVVLSCTSLFAGCTGTFQSQQVTQDHLGNADLCDLHVRAVRLVKALDDRAVAVVATFINYGEPDVLTAVTIRQDTVVGTVTSVARYSAASDLSVGTDYVIRVGGPGHPRIEIPDPGKELRAGFLATVNLSFELAGTAVVDVIVDEPEEYLAPYAPSLPPA